MELKPTSETGKGLLQILKNLMDKSPELAVDKLKRVFLTCSLEIQNEDKFVTLLYGQSVLDESPSALSARFPTTMLRVQYAMETALNKSCVKELVVALELSGNGGVLTEIQKWTEEKSKEITGAMQSLSIDLTQVQVPKRRTLSELTPGTEVKPRTRELTLTRKKKKRFSVVEVCNDKIIVGWYNGQIEIYSSTDLRRQTLLNSHGSPVCSLQCTCTEIIAGYGNGKICVWNIEKGILVQDLSIQERRQHASCMRWRAPRLVVGTTSGKVKIWQHCGTSFTLLCSWDENIGLFGLKSRTCHVDVTDKYVIVQLHPPTFSHVDLVVRDLNGQPIRSIRYAGIRYAALDGNHIISGEDDQVVRITDISTGVCLKELQEQYSPFRVVDAHDGVIAASFNIDGINRTIIWNVKAVLEGTEGKLADFSHTYRAKTDVWIVLKLGQNIVVTSFDSWEPTIHVTDFFA